MKKFCLFIIIFLSFFSFLNVRSVNTIDSLALIYDKNNLYEQDIFKINFFSFNVKEIPQVFKDLDIKIISVSPIKELYKMEDLTVRGNSLEAISSNLIKDYTNRLINMGYDDAALYFEQKGFNIESMQILCLIKDLIDLESRVKII